MYKERQEIPEGKKKDRKRDKKCYSMRGKMMRANVSIILAALILCGTAFVVSVFLIVGDYIHTDINFFLTATADNLEAKLEYCEQVIYSLRSDKTVMTYLEQRSSKKESGADTERRNMAEAAFAAAVDISASANLGNGDIPIVEEIYLFDRTGEALHTGYYAMISAEKEKSREVFEEIHNQFRDRKDVSESYAFFGEPEDGFTFLAFTLFNENMDDKGEVIYKISRTALRNMMEDTDKYARSFWAVYDTAGRKLIGERCESIDAQKDEILARFNRMPYKQRLGSWEYRVHRQPIGMDMQVVIGIPENQTMFLMYDSAKIYILLIAVIIGMGCVLSFFMVFRLTRPIEEITDKLQEVKEGDFESKLPEYDSREFNEISETFNEMTSYINHLVKQVYEKQISIKDMELKFLQTQMNPHFMFNVLNTIALQAKMDGNADVYKMISSFSRLIQAKIYRSGKEKVKVGQELEYVEYYLYLQSYRFGDHLHYEIEIEKDWFKELYIPKLCIQLIVENAVVHGIEPKVEGGNVKVRIYEEDNALIVDTTDDGVGFETDGDINLPIQTDEEDSSHNHVGLNNAHHIIRMMYGENYGIYISSKKGLGTAVRIKIPFDREDGQENGNDESNAGR